MIRTPGDFWLDVLTSSLSLACMGLIAALLIAGVFLLRALVRLNPRPEHRPSLWFDTDGTATIEFAMVLPFVLLTILALCQSTLLMGGNVFVHYAAFAATRSAIVQLPADYPGEPPNEFVNGPGGEKYDAIYRSAVYSLVPVAGRYGATSSAVPTDTYVSAMTSFFSRYGEQPPVWIERQIAQRIAYAADATRITILRPVVDAATGAVAFETIDDGRVEPRDPITVQVEHQLNLSVPYIRHAFAHGSNAGGLGRYINVIATSTLTNEGLLDTLPQEPDLPRADP